MEREMESINKNKTWDPIKRRQFQESGFTNSNKDQTMNKFTKQNWL